MGIKPTAALSESPVLTPEMLAACGARYSRNGEGLESILSRTKGMDEDAAVDSIIRMIDYGHQSIADMVPVAMFMDRLSLWQALRVWMACPTAGGQESSTRYIELSENETIPSAGEQWYDCASRCFAAYRSAMEIWKKIADVAPQLMRLPEKLVSSTDAREQRKLARLRRNFAFDRARYFLPMGTTTNVMLLMSARGWVNLVKQLESELLPESQALAGLIREELGKVAPRMTKHARADTSFIEGFRQEFQHTSSAAREIDPEQLTRPAENGPFLEVYAPSGVGELEVGSSVRFHHGRYDWLGSALHRTSVRFGWQALPIADVRDLNRHRTGTKYFNMKPVGTYFAEDQIDLAENTCPQVSDLCASLRELRAPGVAATQKALSLLADEDPSFVYWLPMGAQVFYEHTTTANHFLYQAELRTGLGSHYQYAARMAEVLSLWHELYPRSAEYIRSGTAEPE